MFVRVLARSAWNQSHVMMVRHSDWPVFVKTGRARNESDGGASVASGHLVCGRSPLVSITNLVDANDSVARSI